MWPTMKLLAFQILGFLLLNSLFHCQALVYHKFFVENTPYTRLCSTKKILTVNGSFPGPILYVNQGETIIVDVYNKANYNITIHWHGVKQPRYPWSDGPEFITQCPIRPGEKFRQKVIFSTEEGTLWWHAHSDWSRATVHGAIVIQPKNKKYPYPKPHADVPIVLGEWWKQDIAVVYDEFLQSGGDPNNSDAYTINGQPGDRYPCSKQDTFKLMVDYGKTYLLRLINAAVEDILFFAIRSHQLTVVGTDGSYTKPLKVDYITISPGQTFDVLLEANQPLDHYYMAARVYSSADGIPFDNTTTTAIVQYNGKYIPSSPPALPYLPFYNDTNASVNFTGRLRSLADAQHPVSVPLNVSTKLFFTFSVNTLPCIEGNSCQGPDGTRLSASVNNISFQSPSIDILQAYYYDITGVYTDNFPSKPPLFFNFTADSLPSYLNTPKQATEVRVLEYNTTVEIVFQGTNLLAGTDHPIHLHGHSFYVVGWGFGNFDKDKDPLRYNLVDPPLQNTIAVPKNGWATIRFRARNPGVWLMHCHIDRHFSWGMDMTFIVKNGQAAEAQMRPPPPDMPPC